MSKPNLPPLPAVPWHQFGGVCANSVAAEAIKNYATAYAEEAVRQALASAPIASAEVMDALNWVDDFVARCNRDDRGSCESVNVLRRALASAPVADRQRLRELVDVAWNEATESTAVPDTPWADRLIDKVFPSLAASAPVAGEAQRLYSLGEVPNPMVEALRAAIEGECDGLDLSDQKARYVLASMMNCGLIHAAPQASGQET